MNPMESLKEKINEIKVRVTELEHNLQNNYISKETYNLQISQIHEKISNVENDIKKLDGIPDRVSNHDRNINNFNKMLGGIGWTVFISILGAVMAFIYKGGLA